MIKAFFNILTNRFPFPTSRFSLGLNPKINILYCLYPEIAIANVKCKLIDLRKEYREIINTRFFSGTLSATRKPFILMIPPLFAVRGETEEYIKGYIKKLLNSVGVGVDIVFKLHPKEGDELKRIVTSVCSERGTKYYFLDTKVPIESYFVAFKKFGLCGPPSTAILSAMYFFKESLIASIIVVPDKSNPFSSNHLSLLRSFPDLKVLKD